MKNPEITDEAKGGAKKAKPPRLFRAALVAVLLFVAGMEFYIYSFGPVLWLCGAREGDWQRRLPRGVRAAYDPILSFPYVPDSYEGYLSHFIWHPPPPPPRKPQVLELAVSPGAKVTLHLPVEWTAQAGGIDPSVNLESITPPNTVAGVARLNFAAGEPDPAKQEDVDRLLQDADAGTAKLAPEKKVNLVEIKSASGVGAYAIFSFDLDLNLPFIIPSTGTPNYTKVADGLFLTHGVLVRFVGVSAGDLPKVLKFIEEGIAVESTKWEGGQKLELAVSPAEKVKLKAPAQWVLYALPSSGSVSQLMLESSTGTRLKVDVMLTANLNTTPPTKGPEDFVAQWANFATQWAKTMAMDEQPRQQTQPPVEMKSDSGHGAYAVVAGAPGHAGPAPPDAKSLCGEFVTGDVTTVFMSDNINGAYDDAELRQVLKFISEGITVEPVK